MKIGQLIKWFIPLLMVILLHVGCTHRSDFSCLPYLGLNDKPDCIVEMSYRVYNDSGEQIEDLTSVEVINLNDHGRVVKRTMSDPDDNIVAQDVYSYNMWGELVGVDNFDSKSLTDQTRTLISQINNTETWQVYNSKRPEVVTCKRDRDWNKRVDRFTYYDDCNHVVYHTEYHYNEQGALVFYQRFSPDFVVESQLTQEFNEQNELVRQEKVQPGKEPHLHSFKYLEYDDHNNWIKKAEYHGDQLLLIFHRTIEY